MDEEWDRGYTLYRFFGEDVLFVIRRDRYMTINDTVELESLKKNGKFGGHIMISGEKPYKEILVSRVK